MQMGTSREREPHVSGQVAGQSPGTRKTTKNGFFFSQVDVVNVRMRTQYYLLHRLRTAQKKKMPPTRKTKGLTLKYHGNYCGPNWSAGKYQGSVKYGDGPKATDAFDETCRVHDGAYNTGTNLKAADYKFFKSNYGKGFKRTAAALAVGAQGWFRKPDRKRMKYDTFISKKKMPPRFMNRGSYKAVRPYSRPKSYRKSRYKKKRYSKYKKRSYKRKNNKVDFLRYGAQTVYESGGIVQGERTLYAGVGTPISLMLEAFFKAIVMKLTMKAGINFRQWTDVTTRFCSIEIIYQTPSIGGVQTINHTSGPTDTWHSFATQTFTNYRSKSAANDLNEPEHLALKEARFRWSYDDSSEANTMLPSASINLEEADFTFAESHTISIQNQTLGDGGNNETTTVTVNPLRCRTFQGTKNWTELKRDFQPGTPNIVIGVEQGTGVMFSSPDIAAPRQTWNLPIRNDLTNCNKSLAEPNLLPGNLMKRATTRMVTYKCNTFLSKCRNDRDTNPTTPATTPISLTGIWTLTAFEKALDTRLSTETPIKIGYQTKASVSCCMILKKPHRVPKFFDEKPKAVEP